MFWLYETMGPAFSSPSLVAVWLLCAKNVLMRRKAVVRTLGRTWRFRDPFALTEELFRRALANPQGVEMARLDPDRNLEDTVRWKDGKVRLAPRQMLLEIDRAVTAPARTDSDFPLILSAGLRTPWTANTIHRNPAWRKGKGPHCPLRISREDAEAAGLAEGDLARLETAIGSVELPVSIDKRLRAGHVSVPNGFGVKYVPTNGAPAEVQGVNLNELTAAGDRDPFTGCPHHKHVPCRVSRV